MTHTDFETAVEHYCALTCASVTSGRRTYRHNLKVGGVAASPHLFNLARDVVYDYELPRELREEWARRLGLRLIVEGDHDHLQPWDWRAGA